MLGYDSVQEVLDLDMARDVYVDAADREQVLESQRSGIGNRERLEAALRYLTETRVAEFVGGGIR